MDQYQEAADCLITQIDSNYRPIDKPVYSISGGIVKSSLNAAGAYVLTGDPLALGMTVKGNHLLSLETIETQVSSGTLGTNLNNVRNLVNDNQALILSK